MSEEPSPMPVEAPDAPEPVENVVTGQLLAVRRLRKAAKAGDKAARRAGLRLFNVSALTMGAALAYLSLKANVADPLHLYLGQIMFVLAVLPALVWAKRGNTACRSSRPSCSRGSIPSPYLLLNGHQTLQQYSPETITTAAFAVAIFQAAAVITYFTIKAPPKRGRVWRTEIVSRDMSRLLGYGMIITTSYTVAVQFTDWIPNALAPEIRAVCYGIGIVATFVQSRRWGDGTLPHHDKAIFVIQLLLQVIFSWVALFSSRGCRSCFCRSSGTSRAAAGSPSSRS